VLKNTSQQNNQSLNNCSTATVKSFSFGRLFGQLNLNIIIQKKRQKEKLSNMLRQHTLHDRPQMTITLTKAED